MTCEGSAWYSALPQAIDLVAHVTFSELSEPKLSMEKV